MKNLSTLTPAETLLLTEGKSVPLKELLKVTMMDLLLKQIIRTVEVQNGSSQTSSILNTYVVAGNNFSYAKALAHEKIFLSPFIQNKNAEILFANVVKIAFENTGSEKAYNKLVRNSNALAECFVSGLPKLFTPFELNDYGRVISRELKGQLDALSNTLPEMMETNPDKALEILKHITGNVFLVKGIDFKRMAEIENAVMAEVYSAQSVSNSTFGHPMTWLALDLSSSTFDSSYSGCSTSDYSSDGDSGCSADSGCGGD